MPSPKGWNRSQVAEEFGVSLVTVDDWVRKGCPHKRVGKTYVFAFADVVRWLRSRDKDRGGSLEKERARLAREQADNMALKNAVLRGELVPRGAFESELGKVFVAFRSRVMSIPDKAAPQVVGLNSIPEAKKLLGAFCDEALSELSGFDLAGCSGEGLGVDPPDAEVGGAASEADRKRVGRPRKEVVV